MAAHTKYEPNYHPEQLISLSREGYTKSEICAEWGISRDTIYRWKNDKPEFQEAWSIAEMALEAWFIRQFKDNFQNPRKGSALNSLVWLSKNCLKWSGEPKEELENGGIIIKLYENEMNL